MLGCVCDLQIVNHSYKFAVTVLQICVLFLQAAFLTVDPKKERIGVHTMLHYRSVWSRMTHNTCGRLVHASLRITPLLSSPLVGRGTGGVTKLFKEVMMPSLTAPVL